MQGERVRLEVSRQIRKINRNAKEFDCVVLIRGGGAKLDLIAFDELFTGAGEFEGVRAVGPQQEDGRYLLLEMGIDYIECY